MTKGLIRDEKPLWYQQGCLFDEVIDEGQKSWTFTINRAKYDDAHIFIGVADATGDGMAWAFSPTTGSLYFHADLHKWGQETKTRFMPGDALFGRKDGPLGHPSAQYEGEPSSDVATAPTRIPQMIDATIKCIVDMDKQVTRNAPTSSAPPVSSAGWVSACLSCGRVRSCVDRGRSAYSCSSHVRLSLSLSLRVRATVDVAQALSFQINESEIVELSQRDCELPEAVQPWVLLGHPGDQVTISDIEDVC